MATATATPLLTAEEFANLPDPGAPQELVRGRIVSMPVPGRRHGYVCHRIVRLLGEYVESRDLGRVLCNDSGVITQRGPDTVRGADVAYYSFERLPKGPVPDGVGPEIPELVVEVRSPSDRWREIHDKVNEYLKAGVLAVVVLDPDAETGHVFTSDDPPRSLTASDELALPGVFEGFRVSVGRFFE